MKRQLQRIAIAGCAVLMTGCATTATSSPPTPPDPQPAIADDIQTDVADVGTSGRLIPVTSSNAAAAGYDATASIMIVQFQNGRLYEYYNVPPDLWERFIAAQPHPWSAVGYPELVQGGYPYREVTP